MKRYVIRRLLMAIPLLLAISFVCFVFINLIPSNPALRRIFSDQRRRRTSTRPRGAALVMWQILFPINCSMT